jgi:hypothetical protein
VRETHFSPKWHSTTAWLSFQLSNPIQFQVMLTEYPKYRGIINSKAVKAGKAAALAKFSDTVTLSQSGGADYAIGFASPKVYRDYALALCLISTLS